MFASSIESVTITVSHIPGLGGHCKSLVTRVNMLGNRMQPCFVQSGGKISFPSMICTAPFAVSKMRSTISSEILASRRAQRMAPGLALSSA